MSEPRDQAWPAVRCFSAEAARRAIISARRAPRAHGMTVSSLRAVSTTDLIKRVFVFMISAPKLASGRACSFFDWS